MILIFGVVFVVMLVVVVFFMVGNFLECVFGDIGINVVICFLGMLFVVLLI